MNMVASLFKKKFFNFMDNFPSYWFVGIAKISLIWDFVKKINEKS